ncbi:Peptidase M20 domain-containing protein 2, partial [Lamellibrachia satsuma]
VTVFGTPAEEEGSGKIDLLRAGVFTDVDVALMAHPDWCSAIHMHALAIHTLSIKYFGKASHAASAPWEGINALDAAVLCYTNISCLLQQLKTTWRIHGTTIGVSDRY